MSRIAFEDFSPGPLDLPGTITVSRDDIVGFAQEFDPQPFHVDEAAAAKTPVGTLIGSGWHTCALNMRLIADGLLNGSTAMGSPGIDAVKWLRPVRPGDRLTSRGTVLATKESRSRPGIGLVEFRFELLNQDAAPVLEQRNWIMFARRGAEVAPLRPPADGASARPGNADESMIDDPRGVALFDELVVGDTLALGAHRFTSEEIVRYGRAYDPQPFHVDAEAAKESLFGGLCASGWHTAAMWMRLMVETRKRMIASALKRGERPAQLGPSPGFTELKWLRPVYAGDRITYRSTLIDKRESKGRPGWGLVFHHNTAENQRGERVFAFKGCVFWERDPALARDTALRPS